MAKGGIKGPPDDDGGSSSGGGTIVLTSGDDIWPDGADNSGSDYVEGGDGNDIIDGGEGDDFLFGEGGDDIPLGGAGDDFFLNSTGNDTIDGGDGTDRYSYNNSALVFVNFTDLAIDFGGFIVPAHSILDGETGDLDSVVNIENVTGTPGNDIMYGGAGHQLFDGGRGDDQLLGGAGDDTLQGSRGNDMLDGGPGNDTYHGGSHNDFFVFNGEDFEGGEVDIILDYNASADTLVLNGLSITNIETGINVGGNGKKDSILTVENGDGDVGQIILYDVTFDPFEAAFAGGTDADGFLF